jgi:uncharacterized protein YjiS (DUF1127 family)
MAASAIAPRAPFGAITLFRVGSAVERAMAGLRAWWIEVRLRDELSRLTPRQLADIGLEEAPITAVEIDAATRMFAADRR